MNDALLNRRNLLLLPAALTAESALAQRTRGGSAQQLAAVAPPQRMVQLVDTAASQHEITRDYTAGVRLAWALRGGGGALLPQLVTVPIDMDKAGQLQETLRQLKDDPTVIATVGTAGDALAIDAIKLGRTSGLRMAHIGPWMADSRHDGLDEVLPIFPSRTAQMRHAIEAVRGMGIDHATVVYPNNADRRRYAGEIDALGRVLGLRLSVLVAPSSNEWGQVAEQLQNLDSGLVLLVGSAPDLSVLSREMARRRLHRFVLSLSDVDRTTLMQMPWGQGVPLILTQVVPNPVSSTLPVVNDYRNMLRRLFDEAPSPLSLAGMIAGLCALEVFRRAGASAGRDAMLAEVRRRTPMDLGGFRLNFSDGRRGSGWVTHTLLRADGSLVG